MSCPAEITKHAKISGRAPVNAFCTDFWVAYGKLFDALMEDGYDARVLVVSSAFPKIFTAGLDCAFSNNQSIFYPVQTTDRLVLVKDAAAIGANGSDTTLDSARASLQTRKTLLAFQKAIGAPERAPFPVIAAVHGHVIGLGVDLIGVCDIRYAAANSSFAIKVSVECISNFQV